MPIELYGQFVKTCFFRHVISSNTYRSLSLSFSGRPLFGFAELVLLVVGCVYAVILDIIPLDVHKSWDVLITVAPANSKSSLNNFLPEMNILIHQNILQNL